MKLLLFLLMLLQPPQAPPARPPQAPPVMEDSDEPIFWSYDGGAKFAAAHRKPLITFVGCDARKIDGYISARSYTLQGYPVQCIVVADPDGDWLSWRATLPITATDAQIRGERQVSRPAPVSFQGNSPARVRSC